MSPLAIDFAAAPRRGVSLLGLVLLLAGAACLAAVALDLEETESQVATAEARLRNLTRGQSHSQIARSPPAPAARTGSAAAAPAGAATILPRLRTPWHELLAELEQAAELPVAVLSVDAEARGRTLRLAAEAKTMDDVLAFVERLRQSKRLDDVFLLGHEERKVGAATLIAFTVQANWPESRDATP